MTDRYVVDVQVRSCLVHVQNNIENKEIWVAFRKALHVFGKAFSGSFCVCGAYSSIVHIAYLHNIFVKALTIIGGGNNATAWSVRENVAEISVLYAAVGAFLLCIITLYRLRKAFIISFCYGYLYESNVLIGTGAVNIFWLECAVVMGKAALALTMGYSFCTHGLPPSFLFRLLLHLKPNAPRTLNATTTSSK